MCDRAEPLGDGELRNNNQRGGKLGTGDANANDVQTKDGRRTEDIGSLSGLMTETAEEDKVIIWGTDSQCDDPELAEFEMLECQELEAYLVEEGEDFVGLAERKEVQEQLSSCSKATAGEIADDSSQEGSKSILHVGGEQESTASHISEGKQVSRTELSSETDVFVTCPSTILSAATTTQTTDSWHIASGSHSAISEDLTLASQICSTDSERVKTSQGADEPSFLAKKNTLHQQDLDMNLNSVPQSEDVVSQTQLNNGVLCKDVSDEHKKNKNQKNPAENAISDCTFKALSSTTKSHEEGNMKLDKSTQADETPDLIRPVQTGAKGTQSASEYKAIRKQGSFDNTLKKQNSFDKNFKKQPSFDNTLKKQLSFDNSLKKQASSENMVTSQSSSLETRKPWGSPVRTATTASPKTTSCSPKRQPSASPAKAQSTRSLSFERSDSSLRSQNIKPPNKTSINSGIPKPIMPQQREVEPPQKPKNVRPKIITYVRKNMQAKPQDAQQEASTTPPRLSSYSSLPAHKDSKSVPQSKSTPVLSCSNLLLDKYRQEMQKAGCYPPGTAVSGAKPPSSTFPQRLNGKSESFHEEMSKKYLQEHVSQEAGGIYRSPRALRPQLGLGAITRQPAAKTRVQQSGQKSAAAPCQSTQAARVSTTGYQDQAGLNEQKWSSPETTPKSLLLKSGQSGLRPPGFSSLPAARLAALGVIRCSSVSSVSSNQSSDSSSSDPCRPAHSFRTELQKDIDAALSPKSPPKRCAVVSPKIQSPARGRTAAVLVATRSRRPQELDRALIQQLQERCEQQALQLQNLQAHLKKTCLCLDVFSISAQHFYHKSESAIVKEKELSLELARIRDEVAFSVAHWEQLQQEKEDLERRFEAELQGLRAQQQRELGALEERLKARHMDEAERLQVQQRAELEELSFRQQEQLEEMTENHEASLMEMETAHNDTLVTLQEEHARTVKNLKMAHEQQKKSLEEEFEKIRLSLQDQVDTLTFQNRSLRDRAKRFEEALRKSTDEQIVDALAPYKHIEEDLKSLKEVLEMKNQQIHQQELKISELEKIAEKNVYLEEKLQVLQQQNEDLKERIDKNLAVSRQLTEENANLQVHVEKESKEKKRLSRTNEELLWRLQTGELSPNMSPTSSPVHHPPSGPGSPARPHSYHQ
ncbi:microtubule-associated tumor suppressor candidate 2 isoform X2 [Kryptolebias marmoratus]|uniref:microtubule-associated tumor suppressor candidate 2 isoform X2 n=1 Tax=Kryptolebias marmoratus TaxID=37003 RepID=UPI0018ACE8D0|nr:microtubule-associated tumor suppressor candidate 2 isoform X2 [Kryptolebias marmoratus]